MYASTWCNHIHTLFVLVSFPVKEFSNLALMMVTLVESPFRVMLMAPNPSAMQFISCMISFCFDGISPYYTMKTQKVSKKASPPPFGPQKPCPPLNIRRLVCPIFPYWIDYLEGPTRSHHPCWTFLMNASPHAPTLRLV